MYYKWWLYQKVYLRILSYLALKKYVSQVEKKEKPVFIHINKTAGSSIANSLAIPESHFTLLEFEKLYKKQTNKDLPKDVTVYTAIRNPFDKVTSQYFFRIKTDQNNLGKNTLSFDDWVKKAYDLKDPFYRDLEIMFMPQIKWLEASEEYKINYIRFESLIEDFKTLENHYKLKPLPWKKKSENKDYKSLYSSYSKAIIEREFKQDLITFNYTF